MKSYNTIYYLLTVLLIMGGFASMAQNSYGLQILTGVSILFSIIFFVQFIRKPRTAESKNNSDRLEYLVLFFLAAVFAVRAMQIFNPVIEGVFGAAGIFLAIIYLIRTIHYFNALRSKNEMLSLLVLISYLSIVFFCIAAILLNPAPGLARWIGACAIGLAAIFLIAALSRKEFIVGGEKSTLIAVIGSYKDRFFLLLSLFIIFSLYIGLSGTGMLPRLYSDNYPQAYYRLINQAESGKEKPVDGQYRYEVFRKMYNQFVTRNLKNNKK